MALRTRELGRYRNDRMTHHRELRILAIDVRRSRFGYALFEGPKALLEWGACTISPALKDWAAAKAARERIVFVLRLGAPAVLVVKRPSRSNREFNATLGPMLKAIVREATTSRLSLIHI